ncbi:MAG: PHP-associated domain-containing protein, partial [Dehalococcoidia bacterium]
PPPPRFRGGWGRGRGPSRILSSMGTADLHIHTALGDGMAELPDLLAYVEEQTDLDAIAITEHDQIDAALKLRELHARGRYRFDVVVGAEVTTLEGHLLALFVEEPIPSLRPLARTIDLIHRQGGLCVIPHPLSPLTRSIGRNGIERIVRRRADGLWFDGIELANSSPAGRIRTTRARALNAARFHLPEIGGSDAHFLPAVGCARTLFEGATAQELYAAITAGATGSHLGVAPRLREIGPRVLIRQSWRALWATPKRVVGVPLRRAAIGVWR